MNNTQYSRFRKRISSYGFTPEEALHCPAGMPLWAYRLTQEEGQPLDAIIRREQACKVSLARMAESFGVKKCTLGHWARKMKREGGLRFG